MSDVPVPEPRPAAGAPRRPGPPGQSVPAAAPPRRSPHAGPQAITYAAAQAAPLRTERDAPGVADPSVGEPGVGEPERADFLEAVLSPDDGAAGRAVDELLGRGVDASAVYLDLLAPTAALLGEMWTEDACDFVDVTVAAARMQRVVRSLGPVFARSGGAAEAAGRALLSSLPGEQHTLGMFIVAEFLVRDGWGVRVGTPANAAALAAVVRDEWFDVVGFAAACGARLLMLRHEIAAARRHSRNPRVTVLVGGRVFVEHPDLADRVGADGFAASAADAPCRARALCRVRQA